MKKIALIISALFILAFLFGCGTEKTEPVAEATATVKEEETNTEEKTEPVTEDTETDKEEEINTEDKTETEVELVTKEQIVEYFDFTEEELEGIDVDAVIEYCGYTENDLKNFTRELFLFGLKLDDEKIKTDIGYLFEGVQPGGKIPVSQIKTVAFVVGENDASWYWQIRVQEKKAYFCIGYRDNMDLEKCAERSGAITDEYIAELLSCLEKANLYKWKAEYEGTNGNTTGSWGWRLGIELVDGTVYSWRGWGMFGDNKPKEYQSVEDVVESVYGKCPIKFNEDNEYAINFYR